MEEDQEYSQWYLHAQSTHLERAKCNLCHESHLLPPNRYVSVYYLSSTRRHLVLQETSPNTKRRFQLEYVLTLVQEFGLQTSLENCLLSWTSTPTCYKIHKKRTSSAFTFSSRSF